MVSGPTVDMSMYTWPAPNAFARPFSPNTTSCSASGSASIVIANSAAAPACAGEPATAAPSARSGVGSIGCAVPHRELVARSDQTPGHRCTHLSQSQERDLRHGLLSPTPPRCELCMSGLAAKEPLLCSAASGTQIECPHFNQLQSADASSVQAHQTSRRHFSDISETTTGPTLEGASRVLEGDQSEQHRGSRRARGRVRNSSGITLATSRAASTELCDES